MRISELGPKQILQIKDATAGNWRPSDTALMRTMAALLIANSHLENFYSTHPWLAGDGLLGNGMFYFLSGFGVALGSRSRELGFVRWYGRRIGRIYPSVFLGVLFFYVILDQCWRTSGAGDYFRLLIFPTGYPFVGSIMPLYIVLFWLLRARSRWPHRLALLAVVGVYLLFYFQYVPSVPAHEALFLGNPVSWKVHYAFNSGLVLLGALLAPASSRPIGTFVRDLLLLLICFWMYVILKFAMVHGHYPRWFILLHVLASVICLLSLRISAADEVHSFLKRDRFLGWVVGLLAGLTLEMYIVQLHTHCFAWLIALPMPMNLAGFWIITILGAALLAKGAAGVRSLLPGPAKAISPLQPTGSQS